VLAQQAGDELEAFAESVGFGRHVTAASLKGQAEIDWSNPSERRRLLQEIVADADRVLELVREARSHQAEGSPADAELVAAAGLLARVLAQDIERNDDGPAIKEGVAKDRLSSVHDPEMRHGRKSKSKRFDGHKADVAVDTDSQLITAVGVLAGNSGDAEQALERIRETEAATGCEVEETLGDCAYGDGGTRQQFHDAGRSLVAKVPTMTNQGKYLKTDFVLNLEAGTCTCPAGQTTEDFHPAKPGGGLFRFAAAVCRLCSLRAQCVRGPGGRSVSVHPQEVLLQEARAFQASPAFRDCRSRRQSAEHRIARLVQLGIRQARYFGHPKTLFQLAMAAAVANLTILMNRPDPEASSALLPATVFAFCLLLVYLASHQSGIRPLPRAFAVGTDARRGFLPAIFPRYLPASNRHHLRPDF
jgi:hypothetical protein